jgi:hypothetical protein
VSGQKSRIRYFADVTRGFNELLRAPRPRNPADLIRAGIENRAGNFLELARRVIFSNPANPYHQLFRIAGCEYGDLAAAVNRDGLEAALAALHRNGVYLAHDEFKLKTPILRSNQTIAAHENSFRNPLTKGGIRGSSGGSRSTGTELQISAQAYVYREAYDQLMISEFGLGRRRLVLLKPILPAIDGMANLVRAARLGSTVDRWYSPVARSADSTHYRVATYALVTLARLHGVRLPFPTDLPVNDFSPVARWIEKRRREGIASTVIGYASPATRVAAAAAEHGLTIEGTEFLVGGETLTDGKRHLIESTGARVFPRYSISEFGAIGLSCRQMTSGDSVHVFTDSVAVIAHRRPGPFSDEPLSSLLFTSLQLHAPYVLINAEMDDAGEPGKAGCDCSFAKLGFTTVVRDINSFGKITGHGVTLAGTDVLRILEHTLPSRFGGFATDYQLVERDGAGQARFMLHVSRRVPLSSLADVQSFFLQELRECYGGQIASRLWRDADAFEVVHRDPIPTGRGKILPLHLLGAGHTAVATHESRT